MSTRLYGQIPAAEVVTALTVYTEREMAEAERAAFFAGACHAELALFADELPSPEAFVPLMHDAAAERYPLPLTVSA